MEFATQVNSCPDAKPISNGSRLPNDIETGGGNRRTQRNSHYLTRRRTFKTLKKSRPGSSGSDSDSVYNHKHKRKSKHNTRNHKKHNNTRNRTIKK